MILLLLDFAGILIIWLLFIVWLGRVLTGRAQEIFLAGILLIIVLISWFRLLH